MTPHIDGEHHTDRPLLHDLQYEIVDGVPVLTRRTEDPPSGKA